MSADDAEVTFFQQLDLRKQEQAHELGLARIKAEADVRIEREKTRQKRLDLISRHDVLPWLGWMIGIIIAAGIISFAVWGIVHLATSGPPKSVEQIQVEQKQDRWEDCVVANGNDNGAHDNIWYPTAEGGDGLCLPKDMPAPAK